MKKIRFMLSVFFLCLGLSAFAQNKTTIRGTVLDKDNVAIVGANVAVKGTSNGTITDANGGFSISITSPTSILFVTCMGYLPVEVPVSEIKGNAKIILQESSVSLGEVVAIGYGSVRKKDATGAVVAIKADEINRGLAVSPADLLMGKTAGVSVTTGGGAPGSPATIRIRGGSSMNASNDPLIVIDGVPMDNRSIWGASDPLSTINPNDIETFTILKDASSTAIYGARASNGVIIVTTKKGNAAKGTTKPQIAYNGSFSIGTIGKRVKTMSPDEFRAFITSYWGAGSEKEALLGTANTNWQDEIFRNAVSTDHNLSVTGTYNSIPYRASANFISQQGAVMNSNMNRGTFSVGVNPTFLENHLKVNANIKGIYIKNRFADQGAIGAALEMNPTVPVNESTAYGNGFFMSLGTDGKPIGIAIANPVAILSEKEDYSTVKRSIGNAQFDYTFHGLPELKANLNLGYDVTASSGEVYIPNNSVQSWVWGDLKNGSGEKNPYGQKNSNTMLDFYLNYVKELPSLESKVDVMAGYSWQHIYRNGWNKYFLADSAKTVRKAKTDDITEMYMVSLFARVNYSLQEKYLLTLTLRDDASSRFAPENRHGLFPSVGLAWRMSEESFLKDVASLSELKLRLGYGVTGQQDILDNDYPYLAQYEYSTSGAYMMFGNKAVQLLRPTGYDSQIKWEETETYNIGLDYGFNNGRIAGSIDAYYRKTNDMINKIPPAVGTNFTNLLLTNVGNMTNKGIEFVVNTKPVVSKDLNWDLGFNLAYNKNEITKLTRYADASYTGVQTGGISGGTGNYIQMHSVGYPVSSFYVYQQVYDSNGDPIEGVYVDRSGDGKITAADLYHYGKPAPDVIMGLNSKLTYKEWDFSFSARSNMGNSVYNNVQATREPMSDSYYGGFLKNRLASATKTNFDNTQYFSDYYIQDGSFFRIDNITLGYSMDKPFQTNAHARVFLTVQNPLLVTNYQGLDPEIYSGIDNNVYPRPTTFIAGVTINF
jgi:TonB-dependent starch-binding outer membrane protein SusC